MCQIHETVFKKQLWGICHRSPASPPSPRKWCQQVLLRPSLPHAPGVRMTGVKQTPSKQRPNNVPTTSQQSQQRSNNVPRTFQQRTNNVPTTFQQRTNNVPTNNVPTTYQTCLLVEQEDMSPCPTRRYVFLFNKEKSLLVQKETCLPIQQEEIPSF